VAEKMPAENQLYSLQEDGFKCFGSERNFIKPHPNLCFTKIPDFIERTLRCKKNDRKKLKNNNYLKNNLNKLPDTILPGANQISDYQPEKIVLIVVDGFGWRSLLHHQNEIPLLKNISSLEQKETAKLTKITSQFPSSTAPHAATLAYGGSPCDHGIFEKIFFLPALDDMIRPLSCEIVRDGKKVLTNNSTIPSHLIYPQETIYERLNKRGLRSRVIVSDRISSSASTKYFSRSAEIVDYPHENCAALSNTWHTTLKEDWQYSMIYFSQFDAVSHIEGSDSPEAANIAKTIFSTIEKIIKTSEGSGTLFMITADHGHININPKESENTIYLGNIIPSVYTSFNQYRCFGKCIPPSGGLRNLFLHVEKDFVDFVVKEINYKCKGKLEAFATRKLLNNGIFGTSCNDRHLNRLGTVTVLPYKNCVVYLDDTWSTGLNHKSDHGGASSEEMFIPLITYQS
jgi:hypothetical protein